MVAAEIPQLILASASLPIIFYGAYIFLKFDKLDGGFNILGGVYAFLAILLIPHGFPGILIFPVTALISASGSFLSFIGSRERGKLVKGMVMLAVAILLVVFQVML